jgi:hypothetical protein
MIKYNTFLSLFIISIIAFIVFMSFYMSSIFSVILHAQEYSDHYPFEVFKNIFSVPVIISLSVLALSSLAIRIIGIVAVAKSNTVSDGEKALWIVGFVLLSFITSIVFLVMARGKGFAK